MLRLVINSNYIVGIALGIEIARSNFSRILAAPTRLGGCGSQANREIAKDSAPTQRELV
jgi:hypothetical protein